MREIEYRAWHRNNNRMCHNVTTDLLNRDYLEFMQYIGKKDKNGKKIFEGDIVIAEWYSYIEPEKSITGEVIFNDGWLSFCIWSESEKTMSEMNGQGYYTWEIEVIGNIYENPEIIEREE